MGRKSNGIETNIYSQRPGELENRKRLSMFERDRGRSERNARFQLAPIQTWPPSVHTLISRRDFISSEALQSHMISFDVTARRQTSLPTISRETHGGCDETYKLVSCFPFQASTILSTQNRVSIAIGCPTNVSRRVLDR
jgi:hypothetical protein